MSNQQPPSGGGVLVVGLLGLLVCTLLAPIAWIMGSSYTKQCAQLGVQPDGAGTAGKILGIIGTVFLFLGIIGVILAIVLPILFGAAIIGGAAMAIMQMPIDGVQDHVRNAAIDPQSAYYDCAEELQLSMSVEEFAAHVERYRATVYDAQLLDLGAEFEGESSYVPVSGTAVGTDGVSRRVTFYVIEESGPNEPLTYRFVRLELDGDAVTPLSPEQDE